MTIYLVQYYCCDSGGDCHEGIEAAFSTRELADSYIAKIEGNKRPSLGHLPITNYDVDEIVVDEEVDHPEKQQP